MTRKFGQRLRRKLILLGVVVLSVAAVANAQYRVTRIVVKHGNSGLPRAINLAGQVVGSSGEPHGGDTAAFIAQHAGMSITLTGLPGGDYSEAFGINDLGEVVGSSNTVSTVRAVHWTSGGVSALALPQGATGGEALAISNAGFIAGYVSGPSGMQASLWRPDGSVMTLGTLQAGQSSQATAIDSAGDVAGWEVENGVSHAFLWTAASGVTPLAGGSASRANGINDSRNVVGSCTGAEGDRACLWTPAGVENLGTLPGGDYAEAFDINNAGTVVGAADTTLGLRAFVWTRADGMRDLNTLIPATSAIVLSAAGAINERGEIIAYGSLHHDLEQDRTVDLDHGIHAGPTFIFLLTPQR